MGTHYETKHDAFNLSFKEHDVFKDQLVIVDGSDTPFLWINKSDGKVSFSGKYFHLYKEQRLVEALKRMAYVVDEFVYRTDEIVDDKDELEHFVQRFKSSLAFIEEVEGDFKKIDKQKALDVINSLEITEIDGDGTTLFYALVDFTEENKEALLEIGVTQEDIENATSSDKESIDLTCFVWEYADWNNGSEFVLEKPLDDM